MYRDEFLTVSLFVTTCNAAFYRLRMFSKLYDTGAKSKKIREKRDITKTRLLTPLNPTFAADRSTLVVLALFVHRSVCHYLCCTVMFQWWGRRPLLFRPIYIDHENLYNFDPLKPHFCIVKLGFTEVYIIFLISAQKHRLWVTSARRF